MSRGRDTLSNHAVSAATADCPFAGSVWFDDAAIGFCFFFSGRSGFAGGVM